MAFRTSVFAQIGKFTEIRSIGQGAAGQVYVARDNLHRLVAVKEALPTAEGFASIRAKFEKESRLQASLNHPNIVGVYHLEEDPLSHELYLVCEYANAGSLAEMLEQRGPLPTAEALAIAIDICAALEETERQQIVHRDIKPSNILLACDQQERRTAKLGDFGIAQDRKLRRTTILPGTTHPGTPLYMAPEQADATALLDTRADIYALGMTLWEMLTGTDYKLVSRDTDPPDIRTYNAQANPDIGQIVRRAVRPAPAERYQTPQELRADLERVRDGKRPIAAARAPRRPRDKPRSFAPPQLRQEISPARRRMVLSIAAVIGALILLLAYQTFTQALFPWDMLTLVALVSLAGLALMTLGEAAITPHDRTDGRSIMNRILASMAVTHFVLMPGLIAYDMVFRDEMRWPFYIGYGLPIYVIGAILIFSKFFGRAATMAFSLLTVLLTCVLLHFLLLSTPEYRWEEHQSSETQLGATVAIEVQPEVAEVAMPVATPAVPATPAGIQPVPPLPISTDDGLADEDSVRGQATRTLQAYLDALHEGRYEEASEFYGGSYNTLRDWNPSIARDDGAALLEIGCTENGMRCLEVRRMTLATAASSSEWGFLVEFNEPDGRQFVLVPPPGSPNEPRWRFEFTVVRDGETFRVLDLPPYVS